MDLFKSAIGFQHTKKAFITYYYDHGGASERGGDSVREHLIDDRTGFALWLSKSPSRPGLDRGTLGHTSRCPGI
jgi:hypothetical protein